MEASIHRDFMTQYLRSDPDLHDILDERLQAAADYWTEHARKRTGYMSVAIYTAIVEGSAGMEAIFDAYAYYAPYQEFGTRYIEGMHLLAEMQRIMEEGV